MAELLVQDDVVTVAQSAVEKAAAAHGDVSVPRTSVVSARVVPAGMAEVRGLRMPGTGLPRVLMAETRRDQGTVTFAACHGRRPAVVLELTGQRYDRIAVTVEHPDKVAASLT